jgi:LuxR family maltose regulon positive regulatory protein
VVISTRADPDLPLPRWRVRGELVEIRAAELRFTSDESARYLNEVAGLDLVAEDVTALEERTEGWIAALQLAALSIQGRDDARGFIARFAGNDRYIVDYLVEEVLAQQPDPVREFLLHTAVLDRLSGPLCDAVTGRDDGGALLITLERANLFLVPLDDRREWYRYHHLFADVLRARLLSEQPERIPLLHQRASRWYESHELVPDAVRHALAAKDFDRAVRLIELALPALRLGRQDGMLLSWLQALPDAAVRRSPVLSVFYGNLLMAAGDLDAVETRLDDAERALAVVRDGTAPAWAATDELRTLPATIAVFRASLAQARGDVASTAEHARRAFDLAAPTDHLSRSGAAGFLALAAWARGDVSSALETFAQAMASMHAAGALVDELSGTVLLADMWLAAGRPGTARRLYGDGLQTAWAHGEPVARATAALHVGISEIDREVGEFASAHRHLTRAAALDERAAITETRYRWFVAMGRLVDAEGDPQEAIALLDKAEQLFRPGFFPDMRPIAAMKARVWIGQGNLSRAADWAQERGVSAADQASYLREFDQLTVARLLLAQYRASRDTAALDQAVVLLDRLSDAVESSGRAGDLLEIRMLRALAHDAEGHRPLAVEVLARAWGEAPEPDSYARLFLDEGAPMVELLQAVGQQDDPGGHARRLLGLRVPPAGDVARTGQGPALPPTTSSAVSPTELLSDRELQVLRLLASELTGPEIARQLFVSNNTLRTHTKHIFTKLDVTSRRAAIGRARERGLI